MKLRRFVSGAYPFRLYKKQILLIDSWMGYYFYVIRKKVTHTFIIEEERLL